MKRRDFIRSMGASAVVAPAMTAGGLATLTSCATSSGSVEPPEGGSGPPNTQATVLDEDGLIGGLTLSQLRDRYHRDLFDDFLPFMHEHVIDHEYGGFMCNADRRGVQANTEKVTRFEGRGIWVYSHLYRILAGEQRYLDVARRSVEFLMPHAPEGDQVWPSTFQRDGTLIPERGIIIAGMVVKSEGEVYDDLFVAEGFQEYGRATGDQRFWNMAKDLLLKSVRLYDSPTYAPHVPRVYFGSDTPLLPGCRILGVWMMLIRLAKQMLELREDEQIRAVADRCVDAILEYHLNPEYNLLNEVLQHDMTLPQNIYNGLAYTGHGIETLWMVLDEAHRRRDKALFMNAAELFRRHLEVSWDHVYGGWFRGCRDVDEHVWILDKAAWVQAEALIGLLMVIEHTGADWAKQWFRRGYTFVIEHFPLERHGFALWDTYPDRKVTFVEDFNRIENYHHPRHLILNLASIDRMIQRRGQTSGELSEDPVKSSRRDN